MTKKRWAKRLAAHGLRVFNLHPDGKQPMNRAFSESATRNPTKIDLIWEEPILGFDHDWNIGIAMGMEFIGVDIDDKDNRDGSGSVFALELEGCSFPPTFTQHTPTGGTHYVYRLPKGMVVRNSAQKLAPGIDIRGSGGLLVGAGSTTKLGAYSATWIEIAEAPAWLLARLARGVAVPNVQSVRDVSPDLAERRARSYLASVPGACQGARDSTAYSLACELSNLGVDEFTSTDLLADLWASRCTPPFPLEELIPPVTNGYRYVREKGAVSAPENDFDEIKEEPDPSPSPEIKLSPVKEINQEYAFALCGSGHSILHERTDAEGRPEVVFLNEATFHATLAARIDQEGKAWSRRWMKSVLRRNYKGFAFSPGRELPRGWYNLFRGFSVIPSPDVDEESRWAVNAWMEHGLQNICDGNEEYFQWVMGYFAHLIQRPYEKPLVSLVLKGRKGVGKNAFVDRVGFLLGSHYRVVDDRRYLVGNFNSHLEKCLLITLDEAFWSGDKHAEGRLKGLITGKDHVIERKGQEPYDAKNLTRVVILGNEGWLIPASEDERRFMVLEVGEGRKRDNDFFHRMRVGMENGGYSLLMDLLMKFDLSSVSINRAPETKALGEQKVHSLSRIGDWWHDVLKEGSLTEGTFDDGWPPEMKVALFRETFYAAFHRRHPRGFSPSDSAVGKQLHELCPSLERRRKRDDSGRLHYVYTFPSLEKAREEFCKFLGHTLDWGD